VARRARALPALALSLAAALALSGCAPQQYDRATARRIVAEKDAFMTALDESTGAGREAFLEDVRTDSGGLPGRYWGGAADPQVLDLAAGGTVLYDLEEDGDEAAFAVLLSSGARQEAPPVYTCFRIEVTFVDDALKVWRRDGSTSEDPGEFCSPELVATLGEGAEAAPVVDFDG
jgi:hypothetical protein